MKREDLDKLLGGYAAGTLTADERHALFEAALSDQALFEALADEEPLRDALADSDARAQVAAALRDTPPSLSERFAARLRAHRGWAVAAATAAAAVLVGAIVFETGLRHKPAAQKQEIAELRTPPPPEELAAPPTSAKPLEERPAPGPKAVPAPRRFEPPAAVFKQKVPAPAVGGAVGGVVGGIIGGAVPAPSPKAAAPPPPPPAVPSPQRLFLASRVLPGARALFYGPETAAVAEMSRDNLPDREQAGSAPAQKRARALNAPARPVGDLGLRYSLVRRGPDGQDSEVPLDTALDPGEPARLRIEANQGAYLYVMADGAPLFSGPVEARTPTFVPARPGTFDLILSRQPDLAAAGPLLSRTRTQVAAADQPIATEPADNAVYVVNTGQSPNPRVLAEFQLKYR